MSYEPNISVASHGYNPPETSATGPWVTFTWDLDQDVEGSNGGWYQVQFRLADDTVEQNWLTAPASGDVDNYVFTNCTGLANHTEYEFRVRAVYEPGPTTNFSDWSDWFSYTPNETP